MGRVICGVAKIGGVSEDLGTCSLLREAVAFGCWLFDIIFREIAFVVWLVISWHDQFIIVRRFYNLFIEC